MATLPESVVDINTEIEFQTQPTRTWYINRVSHRIQGETDGKDAVQQAVEIILNVERFRWQIYAPYSGMEWNSLIGQSPGYVALELKRRMEEALKTDDRVLGISDYYYSIDGDSMSVNVVVDTVYGAVSAKTEVNLS